MRRIHTNADCATTNDDDASSSTNLLAPSIDVRMHVLITRQTHEIGSTRPYGPCGQNKIIIWDRGAIRKQESQVVIKDARDTPLNNAPRIFPGLNSLSYGISAFSVESRFPSDVTTISKNDSDCLSTS